MAGLRFAHVINAIKAQYKGSEPWLVGAEYRGSEEHALNRIVAYQLAGEVGPPSIATAQARELAELEPHAIEGLPNATDDVLFERRVTMVLEVWAPDSDTAENRIHALEVAIDRVMHSTAFIDSINEDWGDENRGLTMGGVLVLLSFRTVLFVTTTDAEVVRAVEPPAIGEGVTRTQVTSAQVEIDWSPTDNPEPLPLEYPTPEAGD